MKHFNLIPFLCVLILTIMPLLSFGQSGYESFEHANEAGNNEKAYKELSSALSRLFNNPNKMSLEEAFSFFNLYEIITYNQGKITEVDSVYLQAIAYGVYIQSETLQCKYTVMRGNLFRIKNEWKTAIGILKGELKFDCLQEDYIQIHAIL